jgi:hypothetical protein
MAMCNKRFIHSSSISLQRFASLHYLPLHYTSIHFTIYFAPHSKSIPSFHIAKPTLCFPCLGFCFATLQCFLFAIIYKKRHHTQAKATSHSKHLRTFCNIPFSHTLAFSLRYLQFGMLYFFCDI